MTCIWGSISPLPSNRMCPLSQVTAYNRDTFDTTQQTLVLLIQDPEGTSNLTPPLLCHSGGGSSWGGEETWRVMESRAYARKASQHSGC